MEVLEEWDHFMQNICGYITRVIVGVGGKRGVAKIWRVDVTASFPMGSRLGGLQVESSGALFFGSGAKMTHLPRQVTSLLGYKTDSRNATLPCSNSCKRTSAVCCFRPTRPATESLRIEAE